jgi:ABC-2 type transport system permease protein
LRNFTGLLVNEWLKLSKKRSFFVAYAILAVVFGILAYAFYELSPDGLNSTVDFATGTIMLQAAGQLVPVLAVLAAAGSVTQEHRYGTIKFLLIRAQSRHKILASKYIISVVYTLTLVLTAAVLSVVAGYIVYGGGAGESTWTDFLTNIASLAVYSIVFVTMTFMIGILTKSNGASIGVGIFSMMVGSLLVMLLSRYTITKYLLFSNTDLSVYNGEGPPIEGMTMAFSIVILLVYMALFLSVSFAVFKKRDIA